MKKYNYTFLLLVIFAFFGSSCVEDLPTKYEFTGYQFSNLDANAGQWKLVLHTSNEQIPLSTPAASGSPELLKELADAKEKQNNATSAQREAVAYWTNNPLVRWNEIALELATKYNLIPAPNPDGSYPVPDPANPSNYPKFPYSHPPYTSRMLAHLSVAQYDGLIMAWHYKYKFKRQALTNWILRSNLPIRLMGYFPILPMEQSLLRLHRMCLRRCFLWRKSFWLRKPKSIWNLLL
jgi:hypothetical protein